MKTIFISLLLLVFAGCGNQSEKTSSANNQTTPADSKPVVDNPEEVSVKSEKDVQNTEPGKKGKQKIIKDQKGNPIYPAATDAVTPNEKKGASNETGNGIDADGKALNTNFKDEASTDDNTIIYVGIFAQWNYDNGDHYDGSYDTAHRLFILCNHNDCHEVPINQIIFPRFGSCDSVMRDMVKVFDKRADGTINPVGKTIKIVGDKGVIQSNGVSKIIKLDAPTMSKIKRAATYNKQGTYQLNVPPAKQKEVIFNPALQKDFTEPAQQKQIVQPNTVKSETPVVKQKVSVIPSQQKEAVQPSAAKSITPVVEEKKSLLPSQTYQKNDVKVQSQSSIIEQQKIKEAQLQAAPQAVVTNSAPVTEAKKQQALFQKIPADTTRAVMKIKPVQQTKTNVKVLAK